MKNRLFHLEIAGILLALAPHTRAQTPQTAIIFAGDTTAEPFVYQGVNSTMGWEFIVRNEIVVTQLGFYNSPGGLADPHPVGIWNASGSLLAQAVVPAGLGAQLDGNFLYVDIAPTRLPIGGPYVIGALYYGGHPDLFNGADSPAYMNIDPSISSIYSRWIWAPSLTLPSNRGGANVSAYFGPNFKFTAAANQQPVADNQSITTAASTAMSITLTASDPDNDPLTYQIVAGPAHGTLTGSPPNITYTPTANYTGPDSFTFKANDGQADSNIGTVTISVSPGQAGTITLNDGGVTKLEVVARDTHLSYDNTIEDLFPTSLPFSDTSDAVVGASGSHAEYYLAQTGFRVISSGVRSGLLDSRANVQPVIFFSVSIDTPYSITGTLSVDDPGTSGKFVGLTTTLTDVDTAEVLFNNDQSSFGVVDQSFVLGGTAGNNANSLSGSQTGLLLAGHRYRLFFGSSIYAANSGDPATFTGRFEMSFTASKATPVVTWANPADIVYGTALGSAQLNATANVPGTFAYTPAAGTILNAGSGQTISVSFTPTDTAHYTTASASVMINVLKATPVIAWGNPADLEYGTPLGSAQLNATANVPGAFIYTPPAGTILGLGRGQTLSVNFIPTDTANYTSAHASVVINVVDRTPPVIIKLVASPNTLWPPNHKMVRVTLSVQAKDLADSNPVSRIVSVSSSEPVDGLGDGDTAPDWEVTGDLSLNLRAERSGAGNGRIYTVTVECKDASGNASTASVPVFVPHDQ